MIDATTLIAELAQADPEAAVAAVRRCAQWIEERRVEGVERGQALQIARDAATGVPTAARLGDACRRLAALLPDRSGPRRLAACLSGIRWPIVVPTAADRQRARWRLGPILEELEGRDQRTEHGLEDLVRAWHRARRVRGLPWEEPVGRAIAEREADEVRLQVARLYGVHRPLAERRLYELVRIDPSAALEAAARLIEPLLHLVSVDAEIPTGRFLALTIAYARGEVSLQGVRRAGELVVAPVQHWTRAGLPVLSAAEHVQAAVNHCREVLWPRSGSEDWSLPNVPVHVAYAIAVDHGVPDEVDAVIEGLAGAVDGVVRPLTRPDPAALAASPEAVQVAWDLVADDPREEHTVAELVEAHTRAAWLGLDWSDPTARAVAERCAEVPTVAAVVGAPNPQISNRGS